MDLRAVYSPKWIKGLTLSADWWHIDMRDMWRRSARNSLSRTAIAHLLRFASCCAVPQATDAVQ